MAVPLIIYLSNEGATLRCLRDKKTDHYEYLTNWKLANTKTE